METTERGEKDMTRLRGDYVYTSTGRQRPVFLAEGCGLAQFSVECATGDRVRIEVSCDPLPYLREGRGHWELFEGGMGGGVYGITALRLAIDRAEGLVCLKLEQHCETPPTQPTANKHYHKQHKEREQHEGRC